MPSDMDAARRKLSTTVFLIGGVLLILTAMVRLDLNAGQVRLISQPGRVWHLVVFFLLGLVLLAQARYAALRNHWYLESIPAGPNLAPRWALYSLILFGSISCLALVLPTQYSIGLLDLLRGLIGIFLTAIGFLQALLIAPFIVLFNWLSTLFGKSPQGIGSTTSPAGCASASAGTSSTSGCGVDKIPGFLGCILGRHWFFVVLLSETAV